MIDALAREPHFIDHLVPTWLALPPEIRGTFYVDRYLREYLAYAGVDGEQSVAIRNEDDVPMERRLCLVAAYRDLKLARGRERLCILAEHGAGQSYTGTRSGSYVGAPDRAGVVAVLVPGPLAAERHRASHPTIPAYEVGCPKLDSHFTAPLKRPDTPCPAITFHWDCQVAPETLSARREFQPRLAWLRDAFPDILGHGHPRALDNLRGPYKVAKIELVEHLADLMGRAWVLCADNTSAMYEWAALDRPVVVMNSHRYRRDVEHGLRFWSHADLGPLVWSPDQLPEAIERAYEDPPELAERRREIVRDVYGPHVGDGRATERAVEAVMTVASHW